MLLTVATAAEHTGLSTYTIGAIKKWPDSPFSGRFTTPERLEQWILDHPDFVASRIWKRGPQAPPPDPVKSAAGKLGALARKRARQTTSQSPEERPLDIAG